MKRKYKKFPGVTLLELIIVLAIFSGIAVGALAMVRPAMQVYHMSAAQENAIASVDTVARYIQDSLRYAENVNIYTNHGIKDIDLLLNAPFEMCRQGKMIMVQQSEAGKSIHRQSDDGKKLYTGVKNGNVWIETEIFENDYANHIHKAADTAYDDIDDDIWDADTATQKWMAAGTPDFHQWINPLSYYAKAYYADSVCNEDNYMLEGISEIDAIYKRNEAAANYYSDKVIYIMEITDTAEVNLYEFPLKDDPSKGESAVYYNVGYIGINSWYGGQVPMTKSSISADFSGSIKVKDIEVSDKANEGIKITLNVTYKGATQELNFDYDFPVSFPNTALKSSYIVNEMKSEYSYPVDSYDYFDWSDKFFSWPYDSINGKEQYYTGTLQDVSGYGRQYYCPISSELYTPRIDENGNPVIDNDGNPVLDYHADKAGYIYIVYSIPEIIP